MSFLAIFLQIVLCVIAAALIRRRTIAPILSVSLAFYIGLWYVLPATIGIVLSDRLFGFGTRVAYSTFCRIVCVESAALIASLLFLFRKKPFFSSIVNGSAGAMRVSYKPAVVIIGLGLAINAIFDPGFTTGDTYGERNLYAVTEMGTDQFNSLGPLSVIIALWISFAYAAMLEGRNTTKRISVLGMVVWLWIALSTGRGIAQGIGITSLLPFILLMMMARVRGWNQKRVTIFCGVAALITLTVGSVVGDIIRLTRFDPSFDKATILAAGRAYLRGNGSATGSSGAQEMITTTAITVFRKFDSFSGAGLLLQAERAGSGGAGSVLSSFLAVVPRTLMPDKPVPGSADGTYVETPGRIAGREAGMDLFASMTGVTPCAIAVWELGYPNIIVLVICNVGLLIFLNSLLLTNGSYLRALGIYMLGLPTFLSIFPSPDVVIMNMERALLVYALIAFCGSLFSSSSRVRAHAPGGGIANIHLARSQPEKG